MKRLILALLSFLVAFSPPTMALSASDDSQGYLSEAKAGVYTMVIVSTVDNPALLKAASMQQLIDEAFRLYHELAPNISTSEMTQMRDELRGKNNSHGTSVLPKLLTFSDHLMANKPPNRRLAWQLGNLAVLLQLNAKFTKSHERAHTLINLIARIDTLDPILLPMRDLRMSLVSLKAVHPQQDDWEREAISGHAISTLIVLAGTGLQPPITSLIVGRPVASQNSAAQHLLTHIEVIYGDGRIKTISSYTDGTPTSPKGVIHCGIDKLPYQPAIFAIPLNLPIKSNTTSQTSIASLAQACLNFEATEPHLTYLPPDRTPDNIIPRLLQVTDPKDWQFFQTFAQQWQR